MVEKAKRAVFSVVTYDKNDKNINTEMAFFVTEDGGIALSDAFSKERNVPLLLTLKFRKTDAGKCHSLEQMICMM